MKQLLKIVTLVAMAATVGGCVNGYWMDRKRDAADMFTLTVGSGAGLTMRAGPVHLGLFTGKDQIGLRGGECGLSPQSSVFGIGETFDPLIGFPNLGGGPWCFWQETFFGGLETTANPRGGIMNLASARKKEYSVRGNCPFVAVPVLSPVDRGAGFKYPIHFLTEIEIAVGLGMTIRLGLNPGEMLDFILGWTTIDMYGDDVARNKGSGNKGIEQSAGADEAPPAQP